MPLLANYHTHTTFCDGKNTAEEMVQEALRLGFAHLGFSGHCDPEGEGVPMDKPAYLREIRRLQQAWAGQIEILAGLEMDCFGPTDWLEETDYCIGSTHMLRPAPGVTAAVDWTADRTQALCDTYYGGDGYALAKAYYETEAGIADRFPCTFIGHFDLVARFNEELGLFDEEDPRYLTPARDAMAYLVREKGLPLEVNTGALNRNRRSVPYPAPPLLRFLRELGGEILISSDAHQKEKLAGAFPEALRLARAIGFDHVNLLTRSGWLQQGIAELLDGE